MDKLSDYVMYGGKIEHLTEAASLMQCSGCDLDYIFRWFGIKQGILSRDGRILNTDLHQGENDDR